MAKKFEVPQPFLTEEADVPLGAISPYSVQSRVRTDDATVEEYTFLLREHKVQFPRVILFTWEPAAGAAREYHVGEGFHRIEAFTEAGRKTIPAVVHHFGCQEDAYQAAEWCSVRANADGSKPRTPGDKRRAIKLTLERYPMLSNTKIGELLQVDKKTVNVVRCEMEGRPAPHQERPAAPTAMDLPADGNSSNPAEPVHPEDRELDDRLGRAVKRLKKVRGERLLQILDLLERCLSEGVPE